MIVASGGRNKPKYVCAGYINRGTCTNNLRIGAEEVEHQLLVKLEQDLLPPDSLNFAIEEFGRRGTASGQLTDRGNRNTTNTSTP